MQDPAPEPLGPMAGAEPPAPLPRTDDAIPPAVEAEWAALLAEEAKARGPAVVAVPPLPVIADLFEPAPAAKPVPVLPALLPETDPDAPLALPIANLLRRMPHPVERDAGQGLERVFQRLADLRQRMADAPSSPRR